MGEEEYRAMFGNSRDEVLKATSKEIRAALKSKDKAKYKELKAKFRRAFVGDDVFWANEVASNLFLAVVLLLLGAALVITLGLNNAGIFDFNSEMLTPIVVVTLVGILIAFALEIAFKGQKPWIKYVLMFAVIIAISVTYTMIGFRSAISLTIPIVLSTKYLSEKYTKNIALLSGILMLVCTVGNAYMGAAYDLNNTVYPTGTVLYTDGTILNDGAVILVHDYLINLIKYSFMPNLMQYLIACYVCVSIAKWGHRTFLEQERVAKEYARVDTELNLAKNIQANMLPRIFPAFPTRPEIDIYATMDPAKEVGGDFYDFFLIDDDHIGIVIADVSGKGVPAALFMMIGKTLIKNQALLGITTNEVLERVNNQLCENNEEGLFITAWVGILEIDRRIKICQTLRQEHSKYKKSFKHRLMLFRPLEKPSRAHMKLCPEVLSRKW